MVTLLQKRCDFSGGEVVAGFDGGFAGDNVEQLVEQVASVGCFVAGDEKLDDLAQHFRRAEVSEHGGISGDEKRVAAEGFDLDAELGQRALRGESGCGVGRGQRDRLGDEQTLGFHLAGEDFFAELFVQDSLVQGVLIDNAHPLVGPRDEVAVVDLKAEVRDGGR